MTIHNLCNQNNNNNYNNNNNDNNNNSNIKSFIIEATQFTNQFQVSLISLIILLTYFLLKPVL